ncbi:MAG: hypothetical protein HYW27_04580 [Candidatus Aenigmarchaeota archaeon]|nr:hypothetical protein [Candidatus Aenigmarchaeota archaeon]
MEEVERLPEDHRRLLGNSIMHVRDGIGFLYDAFKPAAEEGGRPYAARAEAIVDILGSYMRGNDVGVTADSASVGKEYVVRLFRALGFSEEEAEAIWDHHY